jgi:hypothetical protein
MLELFNSSFVVIFFPSIPDVWQDHSISFGFMAFGLVVGVEVLKY